MFRASQFVDELHATPAPRVVGRQAQPLEDDTVDFVAEQQLGQCELRCGGQRRHRIVADAEQNATRHRLLVVLDFLLDEQLVLVLERASRSMRGRHAAQGRGSCA